MLHAASIERANQRLHVACERLDEVGVRQALTAGADPNYSWQVPGGIRKIQCILHTGMCTAANVQEPPLFVAVNMLRREGETEHFLRTIDVLLAAGADPNRRDPYGNHILDSFTFQTIDCERTIAALLNHGAYADDSNVLLEACASPPWGNRHVVRMLLDHGFSPNGAHGGRGISPVISAIDWGDVDLLRMLPVCL